MGDIFYIEIKRFAKTHLNESTVKEKLSDVVGDNPAELKMEAKKLTYDTF